MKRLFSYGLFLFSSLVNATVIPIDELFTSPIFSDVDINPKGDLIAAHTFENEVHYIVVIDAKTLKFHKKLRFGEGEYFKSLEWVDSDTLYISYKKNKNFLRGFMDLDSKNLDQLNNYYQFDSAGIMINTLPEKDDVVLFAKYEGDRFSELKVYEVSTSELLNTPGSNKGFANAESPIKNKEDALGYSFDKKSGTYFSVTIDLEDKTLTQWFLSKDSEQWQELYTWKDQDYKFEPFAQMGKDQFLVLTNKDSDHVVAAKFNSKTKVIEEVLYQHPRYDLISASLNEESTDLSWVAFHEGGNLKKEFIKSDDSQITPTLTQLFHDKELVVIDHSTDDQRKIVLSYASNDPGTYFLIEGQSLTSRKIASRYNYSEDYPFASTDVFNLDTPDGDKIEFYYTSAIENRNDVLLVMPHGGPIGTRDLNFFDKEVQFLANRGFSVLRVNFRGSSGFGKSFREKGVGEFGKLIEQDIKLAFDQVVQEYGYKRACTIGISYGGYSSLMLPILYPESFECAIGAFGIYDLPLLFNESNHKVRDEYRKNIENVVGKYSKDLRDVSPVYRADELDIPVFLIAGAKDDTARPEHTNRMKMVLEKLGKDVQNVLYKGSGHGHSLWIRDQHQYVLIDDFLRSRLNLEQATTEEHKNALRTEMVLLADGYEFDVITQADKKLALEYYTKAADLEDGRSMFNIGSYYHQGTVVEKDLGTAMDWYQKSSDLGYKSASYRLGRMWRLGENGVKDPEKSYEMYQRAHEQGFDARAGIFVGRALCLGSGIEKDVESCLNFLDLDEWQKSKPRHFKNKVTSESYNERKMVFADILLEGNYNRNEFAQVLEFIREAREIHFLPVEFDLNNEGLYEKPRFNWVHDKTEFNVPAIVGQGFGVNFDLHASQRENERYGAVFRWTRTKHDSKEPEVVHRGTVYSRRAYRWRIRYELEKDELDPAEYLLEIFTFDKKLLYQRMFNVVSTTNH